MNTMNVPLAMLGLLLLLAFLLGAVVAMLFHTVLDKGNRGDDRG
jgi:uncharacterized membrane protein